MINLFDVPSVLSYIPCADHHMDSCVYYVYLTGWSSALVLSERFEWRWHGWVWFIRQATTNQEEACVYVHFLLVHVAWATEIPWIKVQATGSMDNNGLDCLYIFCVDTVKFDNCKWELVFPLTSHILISCYYFDWSLLTWLFSTSQQ